MINPNAERNSGLAITGAAIALGALVLMAPRGERPLPAAAPTADEAVTECVPSGVQEITFKPGQGVLDAVFKIEGPVGQGQECHTEAVGIVQTRIDEAVGGHNMFPQPKYSIQIPAELSPVRKP